MCAKKTGNDNQMQRKKWKLIQVGRKEDTKILIPPRSLSLSNPLYGAIKAASLQYSRLRKY